MPEVIWQPSGLGPIYGYALLGGLFVFFTAIALYARLRIVRGTHDFIVADRRVGLGLGVPMTIAAWTWAMAVMMSAAMTFRYGLSGLFWFSVGNGLAVIAVIPFAGYLRRTMPHGYTINQFISERWAGHRAIFVIFVASMLFGMLLQIVINLKGTSLLISTMFDIDWRIVPIITMFIVTFYGYFGGMWTSAVTGSIQSFGIMVPASIVVYLVLERVGGAGAVLNTVAITRPEGFIWSSDMLAPFAFGIALSLGLMANTISDQTFWQKVWAIKPKHVTRVFLWGGAWFYVIPICMGLLGLTGAALGVDLQKNLGGDAAAIGPFLIANMGLPTWLILLYGILILSACFSTIDSAYVGTSSITAVDIVKRGRPQIAEKPLFLLTKLSLVAMGLVSVAIVLSGLDFVSIVMLTYALKTSVMIPLVLAVFWNKTPANGALWGVIVSIVVGMPIYFVYGEFWGTLTILGLSLVIPLVWGLAKPDHFDTSLLKRVSDLKDKGALRGMAGAENL